MSKKILIVNSGSLGDLHPFLGVAKALQKYKAEVCFVSSEYYRSYVESFNIPFASMRPYLSPEDPEILNAVLDQFRGPEKLHRNYIFKDIRLTYEDFMRLAEGFDLVFCGILAFIAPTVCEQKKIPWVCGTLSPLIYWSAHEVPVVPQAPMVHSLLKALGPKATRLYYKLVLGIANSWAKNLHSLRKDLGLKKSPGIYQGMMHSPYLNLAMFSKIFAKPQIDWPQPNIQTGFVDFDGPSQALSSDLENFLAAGDAPILFTLGSTTSERPGYLLDLFLDVARRSPRRSLFVVGKKISSELQSQNSNKIHFASYLPYSKVMPRVEIIVHQGGVGTTAQAMKSSNPSLIVAEVNDQPDNGKLLKQSGMGDWIHLKKASPERVLSMIDALCSSQVIKDKCIQNSKVLNAENAADICAREILKLLK